MSKPPESNIILVGFMATGKTAVGKELSRRLGRRFVDTDRRVEALAGLTVARIFKQKGEAFFRNLESVVAAEIAGYPQGTAVISTGGGMVLNPANRANLDRAGLMVLLTATPETILDRLNDDGERPLLAGMDRPSQIREILARREAAYACHDLRVDTEGKTVDRVANDILRYLESL